MMKLAMRTCCQCSLLLSLGRIWAQSRASHNSTNSQLYNKILENRKKCEGRLRIDGRKYLFENFVSFCILLVLCSVKGQVMRTAFFSASAKAPTDDKCIPSDWRVGPTAGVRYATMLTRNSSANRAAKLQHFAPIAVGFLWHILRQPLTAFGSALHWPQTYNFGQAMKKIVYIEPKGIRGQGWNTCHIYRFLFIFLLLFFFLLCT